VLRCDGPGRARAWRDPDRSRGRSATRAPRRRRGAARRTAWSRSPGRAPATMRRPPACPDGPRLLDGLLQARAGGEARNLARRDGHRLAGAGVATLARAALGDVELPETGEAHVLTTLQRVLDGRDDGIDRGAGVLLAQAAGPRDLVDELRLGH